MYWAVLTLGPLAWGAAFALSAQPVFEQLAMGVTSDSIWRVVGVFALSWMAFTLMFLLVPNRSVPVTHALVGAFLSALLFGFAKKAFVAYVANASFKVIYGTLATIPIFLLWLYLVWVVILLGASLAASLTTFKDRKTDWGWPAQWEFLFVYRLVGYLWQAQARGRACSIGNLLESLEGATETALARQLSLLYNAGIVIRDEDGNWLLSRDLDSVSLLDLYRVGRYYLPIGEKLDIPTESEWDEVFFRSVTTGELNMEQSLKKMYGSV